MAKVNHSYMKQNTFLSPIGLQRKTLSDSKREFILSELRTMREDINKIRVGSEKVAQKSR